MTSQKVKILVTGANGQLGKKIIDKMSSDFDLVLTDADSMDITKYDAVIQVMKKEKPQYVIHGAAYTRVDAAEENEALCRKVNVEGTENVAKAAKENGSTVVYISTDYVFDGRKKTAYTEEDQPNPLSVYGMTKYEGEKAVAEICEKHYILRIAWLFGELPEGRPGANFVETMKKLAKEKDSLSIVDDQIGSPTYTGDLVEVIKKITAPPALISVPFLPYGLYHFSGAGETSWYGFAREIFRQINAEIKVEPVSSARYPQKASRPPYSYLDKSKIERFLKIKVRTWQDMLKDYLKN